MFKNKKITFVLAFFLGMIVTLFVVMALAYRADDVEKFSLSISGRNIDPQFNELCEALEDNGCNCKITIQTNNQCESVLTQVISKKREDSITSDLKKKYGKDVKINWD